LPNQAIYSFPTRRSSDLTDVAGIVGGMLGKACGAGLVIFQAEVIHTETMVTGWAATSRGQATLHTGRDRVDIGLHHLGILEPPRSEEHTSELQSRGHLVC